MKQSYSSSIHSINMNDWSEHQLTLEIAELEGKLEEIGQPGNDLYKRAIANVYRGLICVCKDQLSIIRSAEAA